MDGFLREIHTSGVHFNAFLREVLTSGVPFNVFLCTIVASQAHFHVFSRMILQPTGLNLSHHDHFELFWALEAKWLSDGLWKLVLSSFGPWWRNGSQMASGGSF